MQIHNRHELAQDAVLAWYEHAARDLPWRITPKARARGMRPNPYHVWLSEIMLQQTTVATVKAYFEKFTSRWPTVGDLAAADRDDVMAAWAGLGYYARARNLHKAAQMIAHDFDGTFPEDEDSLRQLPGVGPYTAAAISAFAFGHDAVVVDGNIERITARWDKIETPLPKAKSECTATMAALTPMGRKRAQNGTSPNFLAGDFAQALMDIGSSICTASRSSASPSSASGVSSSGLPSSGVNLPSCLICPLEETCASKDSDPARLPVKMPKKKRPDRFGHVLIITDDAGHVLLSRRPDKGLLGGLDIFPTNDWPDGGGLDEHSGRISPHHPAHRLLTGFGGDTVLERAVLNDPVHHIFSHFRVIMTVEVIRVRGAKAVLPSDDGLPLNWAQIAHLDDHALPTVMVKCAKAARII